MTSESTHRPSGAGGELRTGLVRRPMNQRAVGGRTAGVAQKGEHLLCKQAVAGSIPAVSSAVSESTPTT